MDEGLLHYGLTSLVTLFVVVDPLGVAPISVAITQRQNATERRVTLNRAVTIAFGVALFFLLAGRGALSLLGVSVHAFAISGGLGLLIVVTATVYGLAWLILHAGERVLTHLGQGKVHIITRVLGIVLAALAVQYVLNGFAQYYQSLVTR